MFIIIKEPNTVHIIPILLFRKTDFKSTEKIKDRFFVGM